MVRRLLVAAAVVMASLGVVRGQGEYEQHLRDARRLHAAKDYARAVAEFEAARRVRKDPDLLVEMGAVYLDWDGREHAMKALSVCSQYAREAGGAGKLGGYARKCIEEANQRLAEGGPGEKAREKRVRASKAKAEPAPRPALSGPPPEGMVLVPAGEFMMGSEGMNSEGMHKELVAAFYLDRTEVTVAAYEACVKAGRCSPADKGLSCNAGQFGREKHPINCVDTRQAETYCGWAGRKRLPTEVEWEYAARGPSGSEYPWGNEKLDSVPQARLCGEESPSTCEVGGFGATLLGRPVSDGLYDMAGNVAEWTSTIKYIDRNTNISYRVVRGGWWGDHLMHVWVCTHCRWRAPSSDRRDIVGFRCARSAPKAKAETRVQETPAAPVPPVPPPEDLVLVPGGEFMMGSDEGSVTDRWVHKEKVAAFYVDRTEVTVAAYEVCVRAGRCSLAHTRGTYCNAGKEAREKHPINCVDARQAETYCGWAGGKRLPTEVEWEYAARGPSASRFPWGGEEPNSAQPRLCWKCYGTCEVRGFGATLLGRPVSDGLYDMAGNVAEWTSSPYCQGTGFCSKPNHRMVRGGSWDCDKPECGRASGRDWYETSYESDRVGFRCARSAAR